MAALAIDIGYLYNARAEVQRSADSAALAACWEMGDQLAAGGAELDAEVRGVAANAAGMNNICNKSPLLDGTDVTFGYLADIFRIGGRRPKKGFSIFGIDLGRIF